MASTFYIFYPSTVFRLEYLDLEPNTTMKINGSEWDMFPTSGSSPEWNVSSTLERTPENEFQDDLELNLSSLEWNRQIYK